ncbi:hypothetical protein [Alkalinema sp. FACHB-956]|uniref:hypothetical protein n=1 Tax=Alkalinema sp. FACHB-956 TaxID=2692768 RepID=UPI001682721F|nr:hypothetical protein [Alkalinema sp. FACHB-956]MBD2327085.1 hypothetical protein [Alkalinema sp. FACHB-956]
MQPLEPLEQLAVDAFVAAVETCREEGIQLPESVWLIAQSPDRHVESLGEIAKQHPQLNTAYRTARKLLRQAEGDRQKRLTPNMMTTETGHRLSQSDLVRINTFGSHGVSSYGVSQPDLVSVNSFSYSEEIFNSTPNPDNTQPNSPSLQEPLPLPKSDQQETSPPPIYRFVLPSNTTEHDRHYFQNYVTELQRLNPSWILTRDRCTDNESEAYVMVCNNEKYRTLYATYITSQLIQDLFAGFKL